MNRQPDRSSEPSSPKLTSLCKSSTSRTLIAVVGQTSAIVAAAIAAESISELWAICIAVLFIGTRQYGLGEVLVHEASHHNLSSNRKFNDSLGTLLSWLFFFTFEGYRRFHLQHHRTPLDDPENSIIEEYQDWRLPLSDEVVSTPRLFWLIVLRPLVGVIGLYHLRGIASDAYYDSDLKENTCMWLSWTVVVVVLWQLDLAGLLVVYWLTPLIFVFATLNYWSEVGDHYRTSELLTRSAVGVWWNMLIGGNIGYHVVHHRYPGIPWFRLKAAHSQFEHDLLGQTSASMLTAFKQILGGHQHICPRLEMKVQLPS